MPGPTDVQRLRESIAPEDYPGSMLCFVRAASETELEASLDLGETWDHLPVGEIVGAEVVKQIVRPRAAYQLVRLTLKDAHPTIEIAALRAQVRSLRGLLKRDPVERIYTCEDLCMESPFTSSGCSYVNCLFWCVFLREERKPPVILRV